MIIVYPNRSFSLDDFQRSLANEDKDQKIYIVRTIQEKETMESLIEKAKNQETETGVKEPSSREETLIYCVNMLPNTVSALQEKLSSDYIVCLETPNNHKMTLQDLYLEASQEALYFQKREELISLLEKASFKDLQSNHDYFKCYALASQLLRQDELSMKMLETAIQIMRSFQKN